MSTYTVNVEPTAPSGTLNVTNENVTMTVVPPAPVTLNVTPQGVPGPAGAQGPAGQDADTTALLLLQAQLDDALRRLGGLTFVISATQPPNPVAGMIWIDSAAAAGPGAAAGGYQLGYSEGY